MKLHWLSLLFTGVLCIGLLAGCGQEDVSDTSAPSSPTTITTTSVVANESVDATSDTTEFPTEDSSPSSDASAVPSTDNASVTDPTVVRPTVTDVVVTTTTTLVPTTTTMITTTTTALNPNRVVVNGKEYAVGDTIHYTVMVKTAENYGTAKIGVRCLRKGLEVPNGTFQKQNQYVMQNLGIGRLGTMPEDTVGQNGFTMTVNKGYQLDTATPGYSGLLWHYEITNYDYTAQSYREIDCTNGVALFTIALKINKPGDYQVDCMEYATTPRADLTVWGTLS